MHEVQGWRRLGFASEAQYARERLGVSVSSLRAKRALARRLRTLPVVRAALEAGAISFDAAQQIARVATEQTEPLWVERAKCRTAKHLREEVELAEMVARRAGQGGCLPPSEEQMNAYFGVERAIASGQAFAEAAQTLKAGQMGEVSAVEHRQMSEGQGASAAVGSQLPRPLAGQPSGPEPVAHEPSAKEQPRSPSRLRGWHSSLVASAALLRAHLGLSGGASGPARALGEPAAGVGGRQMSGEIGAGPAGAFDELAQGLIDRPMSEAGRSQAKLGRVTLRLRMRRSTARFWREVERDALRWLPRGMCFAEFVCVAVWSAWHHLLDPKVAYAGIYARDRHRCVCPVCSRRDVTPHHVVFRSRGGSDSTENVVALCTECHLALLHQHRIQLERVDGQLRWAIGTNASLVVAGRQLVAPGESSACEAGATCPN